MQHGHELCNNLQERKLKCKICALSVTTEECGSVAAKSLFAVWLKMRKFLNTQIVFTLTA